jgi:ABC-type Fe3+ transport system permease subunit
MYRYRSGRRSDYRSAGRRRRRWPRSRAAGCLLWIVLLVVLLVVLLIVLSVLFGGFQKGTQVKGLGLASVAAAAR